MQGQLLDVIEAARRLKVGRTTVYGLVKSGELESINVGRLRRIPADAIDTFIARKRGAQQAA